MNMLTLKIKDRTYGMRKMPPIKGAAFGLKVANLVSKVLSADGSISVLQNLQKKFTKVEGQEIQNQELDPAQAMTIGRAIVSLLGNVDPEKIDEIFKEAFSWEVYCGSKKLSSEPIFEEHFTEFPGDLYIVAVWATYNHVKDFFIGLGDGLTAFIANSGLNAEQK